MKECYKFAQAVVMLAAISASAIAGNGSGGSQGNGNAVTIVNTTGVDIAYVMMGTYGGAVYGVASNGTDIYHSGAGDERTQFEVGICNNYQHDIFGGSCDASSFVKNCVGGAYYDADFIQSIVVSGSAAAFTCTVNCLPGQVCKTPS